ncbi:MAG: prolipoprotein diacylglyceryl transferase [Planctomycetaceae bacterium]|nr:prolipoprotein diacylglyceryl transferase [Planctomycetaceae bacterium]
MGSITLYAFWNTTGLLAAFLVSRRLSFPNENRRVSRGMFSAVLIGAILGAKLPVWFAYGFEPMFYWDGKSLFGGLLGGFFGMNFYKAAFRIPGGGFGDRFVIPLCVAVGFGKIGCFYNGCCGGRPFGEFVPPTQLYESAFQFLLAGFFLLMYRLDKGKTVWFPLYMILYMLMRFFMEFLRNEPTAWGFLTVYQILALLFLPVFGITLVRRIFRKFYSSKTERTNGYPKQ